jgi:hypothetical protein
MFEAMNRAIAASRLKPIIDKVFSFDNTPAAHRYLQVSAAFRESRNQRRLMMQIRQHMCGRAGTGEVHPSQYGTGAAKHGSCVARC